MNWQTLIDFECTSPDRLAGRLRDLRTPDDVIERANAALSAHFQAAHLNATPLHVTVLAAGATVSTARNFFVVETGAVGRPQLELYLY